MAKTGIYRPKGNYLEGFERHGFLKALTNIAGQVRVPSPSKDDLQEAIRVLREHDFSVVQFGNYRC